MGCHKRDRIEHECDNLGQQPGGGLSASDSGNILRRYEKRPHDRSPRRTASSSESRHRSVKRMNIDAR
jgi:hypothetical protein